VQFRVTQCLANPSRNLPGVSSNLSTGPRCFLEQRYLKYKKINFIPGTPVLEYSDSSRHRNDVDYKSQWTVF